MRILTLLQKIGEIVAQPERLTAIDIDLMLDYTRVLYADLLDLRAKLPTTAVQQAVKPAASQPLAFTKPVMQEPTLAELAAAMERDEQHEIEDARPGQPISPPSAPASSLPAAVENDIRSLIGINDKYQIMSELFGNDKTAYEQALDFINQSSNEDKALHWLREQLWITEESTDAAQSFFEIVARHFNR